MILKELKKILKRFPSEAIFTVTVNGQRIPIVASDISARMYKNCKWEISIEPQMPIYTSDFVEEDEIENA